MFWRKTKAVGVWFAGSYNKYSFLVDCDEDIKLGDLIELDNYTDDYGKKIIGKISRLRPGEEDEATKRLKGLNQRTGKRLR
jgi:hypothetical protein